MPSVFSAFTLPLSASHSKTLPLWQVPLLLQLLLLHSLKCIPSHPLLSFPFLCLANPIFSFSTSIEPIIRPLMRKWLQPFFV
uniref:Uncharacterized protein n=1 Tax=Manihot esculenta TaxID=3983 RepID=A0A2C9VQZ8_MANES